MQRGHSRWMIGVFTYGLLACVASATCLGCSNTVRRPTTDAAASDDSLSLETPIPTDLPMCPAQPVVCAMRSDSCFGWSTVSEIFTTCGTDRRVAHCDRATGLCTCTTIGQPSCSCRALSNTQEAHRCVQSGVSVTLPSNCCWVDR